MMLEDTDEALDAAQAVGVAGAVQGIEQARRGREHCPVRAGDLARAALDPIGADQAAGRFGDSCMLERGADRWALPQERMPLIFRRTGRDERPAPAREA